MNTGSPQQHEAMEHLDRLKKSVKKGNQGDLRAVVPNLGGQGSPARPPTSNLQAAFWQTPIDPATPKTPSTHRVDNKPGLKLAGEK